MMRKLLVQPTVFVVVHLFVFAWGIFEVAKRGMAAIFEAMMEIEG